MTPGPSAGGATGEAVATPPPVADEGRGPHRDSAYARLLRLQHLELGAVQRALLGEGSVLLALLLVLADLVSAWSIVVLPLVVAALVKAHDLLAGALDVPD